MIQLPTKAELEALKAFNEPHSLTIFSPYIQPNSSDNPNRTQLKNLLKEARFLLKQRHLGETYINNMLRPIEKMLDDQEFRSIYQHDLLIFTGKNFFRYYRLPRKIVSDKTPFAFIGRGFNAQIIKDLTKDGSTFLLLVLSHKSPKLMIGDKYNLRMINKFPNMNKELNIDEFPKEYQAHKVGPVGQGKVAERTHGQYNKTQVDKKMLLEFFRHINYRLRKIIKQEKIPLIIAGVDYLLPIYRKANTYPHIINKDIRGNFEKTSLESIQRRVRRLIKQYEKQNAS